MGAMDILLDGSGRRQEVFEKFQVCISISLPYAVCKAHSHTILWLVTSFALSDGDAGLTSCERVGEREGESRPGKLTYTYTQSLKHSNSFFWGL